MRIAGSLLAFVAVVVTSPTFAETIQLASVQVNDPSTQQGFATGALVYSPATGTGPSTYWHAIPAVLNEASLQYDYLTPDPSKTDPVQYGKLDFTVETSGPVWMLTTTRFGGGGNSGGDWLPEVSTESQLEANGWQVILEGVQTETGYSPFGQNAPDNFGWLLFQRSSSAGETFSIRTEKYNAPVILQGVGVVVPEPTTLGLLTSAGVLLLFCAYRKRHHRRPHRPSTR